MHLKDILNLVVNANSKLSDFNVCLNSFYKRVEWKETVNLSTKIECYSLKELNGNCNKPFAIFQEFEVEFSTTFLPRSVDVIRSLNPGFWHKWDPRSFEWKQIRIPVFGLVVFCVAGHALEIRRLKRGGKLKWKNGRE